MKEHDIDYNTKTLKVGQVVTGTVIKVEQKTIYLDLNYFTEGKIHLNAYSTEDLGSFIGLVNVGDQVEGRIQKIEHFPHSLILLSRIPLLKDQAFDDVIKAKDDESVVQVKIKKAIEKGFLADYLGYEVFIPYSLVETEMKDDSKSYVSKTIDAIIIEAERRGRNTNVVATRKPIFMQARKEALEQRNQNRQAELENIKTGDIVEGIVEKIDKNAAIIRFEHVIGLLRISQLSHYRVENISDCLNIGDKVTVKVIKKEGNRLDLSMKALQKTPYDLFAETHKIGDTVTGHIVQKLPFGLVIELEKDVRGLLHKSEFSWNPNDNFDSHVKIGDEVTLSIVNIDSKKERISLSKKALEDNPWKNVHVKKGDIVKGPITVIEKSGVTVEIQGVPAIIPLSELSGERIGKVEDYFAVGDNLEAVVIDVQKSNWVMTLSIRKLQNKNEREDFEKYLKEENDDQKVTIGDLVNKKDLK